MVPEILYSATAHHDITICNLRLLEESVVQVHLSPSEAVRLASKRHIRERERNVLVCGPSLRLGDGSELKRSEKIAW